MKVAWGSKHRPSSDYKQARDGDHLMVPFECDWCIFKKLRSGASPMEGSTQDTLLLACIRRINLDAFWSRASSTVKSNKDRIKSGLDLSRKLGLNGPYDFEHGASDQDNAGYEVALQMVLASRKPGRHSSEYTQWDTIRKLRSSYAAFAKTTPQGTREVFALVDDKGQVERFVQDGTASYWFSRFLVGCKRRMGQDWRPNKAFSTELLLEIIRITECRILSYSDQGSTEDNRIWIVFSTYIIITYTLSLRGSEGFLLDLEGLMKHWTTGWPRYLVIALLGRVKGETNDRAHLLPCIAITSSGINVLKNVQRLVDLKRSEGKILGPAISDKAGKLYTSLDMDTCLMDILEEIFAAKKHLFSVAVKDKEDIEESYQVFRSFRRSSVSRAAEMGVSSNDIDLVNRWNTQEKAKGNRPGMVMRLHYTQMELMVEPFLRYTIAM